MYRSDRPMAPHGVGSTKLHQTIGCGAVRRWLPRLTASCDPLVQASLLATRQQMPTERPSWLCSSRGPCCSEAGAGCPDFAPARSQASFSPLRAHAPLSIRGLPVPALNPNWPPASLRPCGVDAWWNVVP